MKKEKTVQVFLHPSSRESAVVCPFQRTRLPPQVVAENRFLLEMQKGERCCVAKRQHSTVRQMRLAAIA
jgi:hypothetical protein